ncbi:MAG TPA: hypothetical protein VFI34_00600 [Candidatus Limnocylindrales bacterium]|nr:hypothetical protein [Candidatus Limnocylindrales bacterium]
MRRPARARLLLNGAAAVLATLCLVGCELMVAPSASPRPSRDIATPPPTPEATPTEVDEFETLPPEPSGPDDSLVGIAEGLSDLDSFRVVVSARGIVPATTPGGSVSMTSTLVQGDEPAARFVMTGVDGFAGGRLEAIVIGDQAWLREGGAAWGKSPGGAADFDAAFTTMSPVELLREFDALSPILASAGTERRNGIRSQHLHGDASNLAATDAGLTDGTIDVWRATRGGYLVAFDLDGTWIGDEGTPTRTVLRIDVSRVNDATNRISPP